MNELENNWIQLLKAKEKDEEENVLILKKLLEHSPNHARFNAQNFAEKTYKQ